MMKRRVAAQLPAGAAGRTLLEYLSSRFTYHTREEWAKRISEGELSLNGTLCNDSGRILQAGFVLEYAPKVLIEPEVRRDYRIVFEDEYLLVADKPGNLPVHPAGPYFNNTLWAFLQEKGCGNVHFVNRLDRETSGLLIAAKLPHTASQLNKTLTNMQKCYTVLVHGDFPGTVTAKGFLGSDKESPIRKKQRFFSEMPQGAEKVYAVETLFSLLQCKNGFSLLEARLKTGRMHQIRATLRALNYPVAGDKLYGLDEQFYRRFALGTLSADDRAALILERQALHCSKLSFIHPVSGREMEFTSPVPEEFLKLLTN